jgi:hypothetical protein
MSAASHGQMLSGYATAAYSKNELVIASTTADYFTRAGAADAKIIGIIQNDTYAAGDPCTVKLFAPGTFVAVSNESIARGDYVECLASGRVGSGAGATQFVALTAAAQNEYVEFVEVKDLIV